MDARLRGSDGWRGGALGGAKLAARCDRRTGWRGGMERGGASTGGTAALIRTRPQWWLWGCAVRAFGPWRGAAGRAMPALPWTSSQWWPWGCAVRASGPRLGAAGRGSAVRGGGQWWGIRISACRTVSLSVRCMNTKGKARFCRQPARGCGQGALVSGRVGPLVDGRWGPWVFSLGTGLLLFQGRRIVAGQKQGFDVEQLGRKVLNPTLTGRNPKSCLGPGEWGRCDRAWRQGWQPPTSRPLYVPRTLDRPTS